jgi:ABC-type Fe3+-hydroxamate transport system substrate-binding protein
MPDVDDLADWAGTRHSPATGSLRIASLVPSLTETLFALDLATNVVARTGFCVHPRSAVRKVPKIGGTKDPDLARLAALAPTHLVVNVDENRREDVDAARAFVPHVVVTHPRGPDENPRLFRLFGALFGRITLADELALQAEAALRELDASARHAPHERVLYLIWRKPWMTVSRDTYIAATLAHAGLETVPERSDARYPKLADDDLAWREADRILLSTEPYAFRERDAEALRVATGERVDLIDGEWTSWYGVRAIEGMRALAAWRRESGVPYIGTRTPTVTPHESPSSLPAVAVPIR